MTPVPMPCRALTSHRWHGRLGPRTGPRLTMAITGYRHRTLRSSLPTSAPAINGFMLTPRDEGGKATASCRTQPSPSVPPASCSVRPR
jgi:hypothetical protein